eukprot:110771-Alexandrium_andersonii.AAC.1
MSASLVGSEMCIRDSPYACQDFWRSPGATPATCCYCQERRECQCFLTPVSYTHLTLPTICSV